MNNSTNNKITGISLPKKKFQLHQTHRHVDVASVFEVLKGDLAAYRVCEYLSDTACHQIVENFWLSPKRVPRYGDGENGVEGYLIGASHIEKDTDEYLNEACVFSEAIKNLYSGTINPIVSFRNMLVSNGSEYI